MARDWANSVTIRDRARARLRAEGGPCWICGEPIDYTLRTPDPMSFELDHKVAKTRDPSLAFVPTNWAPSHRRCNRLKSDKEHAPIVRRSGTLE